MTSTKHGMRKPRKIIRCAVYDGDKLVEMIEQAVVETELPVVLRRVHFQWRFIEAMTSGKRVVFESRDEVREIAAKRRAK